MSTVQTKCGICGILQTKENTNKQAKSVSGLQSYCRDCQRNHKMQYRYGITMEEALALLSSQDERCAICKQPLDKSKFVIDHCHTTSAVRGVLCNACNIILGHAYDNVVILSNAIEYLKERSKR